MNKENLKTLAIFVPVIVVILSAIGYMGKEGLEMIKRDAYLKAVVDERNRQDIINAEKQKQYETVSLELLFARATNCCPTDTAISN